MRRLIQRYRYKQRKAKHVRFLSNRITYLHNEIVKASFKSEYSFNKNITITSGNIEVKAKLLSKYNRRLKLIKL
jgi:hypothetical protein